MTKSILFRFLEALFYIVFFCSLFLPYSEVGSIIPAQYALGWNAYSDRINYIVLFLVGVPLLLSLPMLFLNLFQNKVSARKLKFPKYLALVIYIAILTYYLYTFFGSSNSEEQLAFGVSCGFSLLIFLLALFKKLKGAQFIVSILFATLSLPVIMHMMPPFGMGWHLKLGGILLYDSFIAMYVLHLVKLFSIKGVRQQ